MLDRPSPNHDEVRPQTLGVVLHGTGGRAASPEAEFQSTINWFSGTASQVSAHIVIATDGRIVQCVDPRLIAWHARSWNETHLGAEMVHPNVGDHITDDQLRSLAWWLHRMANQFGFDLVEANLPQHKDIPPGIADGRRDCGDDYSFARLAAFL